MVFKKEYNIFMDQTEKLKEEIGNLKTRLSAIEKLLLMQPNPRNYIQPLNDLDVLFDESLEIIKGYDEASASLLQRRLSIGYSRAARLLDQLEEKGYVGKAEGAKPRKVIKK